MTTPKVSIISPTYNHEEHLRSCLDSVLAQTFGDWELILIEDASTDGTAGIAREYARKNARIKLVRHDHNWGPERLADTYDEGLSASRGELVAVLEGDDCWEPFKLAEQVKAMEGRPDAVLSYGKAAEIVDGRVRPMPRGRFFGDRENEPVGSILRSFLFGENPIVSNTVVIRRTALRKIGGFRPKGRPLFLVDYPLYMELALEGGFCFVPKVIGHWRRHSGQLSAQRRRRLLEDQLAFIKDFIKRRASALKETQAGLSEYMAHPGYFPLYDLCKICLEEGEPERARAYYEELKKTRSTLPFGFRDRLGLLKMDLRMARRRRG